MMKKRSLSALVGAVSLALSSVSIAVAGDDDSTSVMMKNLKTDSNIGSIKVSEYDDDGVVFTPDLSGLKPGAHGFHIHENGDCSATMKNGKKVLGGAAGGHFDPEHTGHHKEPWSESGHEGDLPALYVDEQGNATKPVFAPELDFEDIQGKAIMIHEGGDNYSDHPKKLGGGGPRVACGVIAE
jgi:Cu-Zn family superoxide dismutase